MKDAPELPAVAGPVERPVRPLDERIRRWLDGEVEQTSSALLRESQCLINGLRFDAFGEPRVRYVRVSLSGNHCIMRPSEGDSYLQDARDCGDDSEYTVADVYLSEREFEDLPEHDGF